MRQWWAHAGRTVVFLARGEGFGILPQPEEAPMERAINCRRGENRAAQGANLQADEARWLKPTRGAEWGKHAT